MAERSLPGLGLTGFWDLGADEWNDGMDPNLLLLSAVTQLSVKSATTALPGSPTDGDIYIVPSGGEANNVAVRDDGAWVYFTPKEGWRAWVQDTNIFVIFDGTNWTPLRGGGTVKYDRLGVNTDADATNKLAVKSGAALFTHDGDDMVIVVNKDDVADDGGFYFQTAYETRAVFGLMGSDSFGLRVSPDGAAFHAAFQVDEETGHIGFGATPDANNRMSVKGTAALFDAETDDFRFVFNKKTAGDDASLTFQTNYSGRALIGLLGSDDFGFTVSPDGSTYSQALVIDKDTAAVDLPQHPKFSGYCNYDQYNAAAAWFTLDVNNMRHNDQAAVAGGVFTAPHDGYYHFGAGIRILLNAAAPTHVYFGFSINNANPLADHLTIHNTPNNNTGMTATAVLKLSAGDTVRVKVLFGTNDAYVDADHNYFNGFQIA
jgi:hypothetical protein